MATVLAIAAPIMLMATPANADNITAAGSDTTQDVMSAVLNGVPGTYNPKHKNNQTTDLTVPADAFCNQIVWRGLATAVPNGTTQNIGGIDKVQPPSGSGEGRSALAGSITKTYPLAKPDSSTYYTGVSGSGGCVDIARSSSKATVTNGEFYAFALDVVGWGSTSLAAPAKMTLQQLRDIWNCNYNNWKDVGGGDAPIQRILPNFGSGTRQYFINNLLNISTETGSVGWTPPVSGTNPITSAPVTCPATISAGNDITGPEENKGSEFLKPALRGQYQNFIFPYSDGKWVYQANNSSNPTLDVRAGVRPGGLVNTAALPTATAAWAMRWTGSTWRLNDATILDGATGTHAVTGVTAAAQFATQLDGGVAGKFTQSDVGLAIRGNTFINDGTVITAVDGTGQFATIAPGAKSTAICACSYPQTATLTLGYAIVSEKNPNASPTASNVSPEYAGVRYVYNMLMTTSPSYLAARALVGFQDTTGGTKSPLCDGTDEGIIADNGFAPLTLLRPSLVSGIDSPVSCRLIP